MLKTYIKIELRDEELGIAKSVIINKPGLQLLPSKTGRGKRWQRIITEEPMERFDPHTIHLADLNVKDVDIVLKQLERELNVRTHKENPLIKRSIAHYYRNFFVPIMIKKQKYDLGIMNKKDYKNFLDEKQKEFEELTDELKEAIEYKRTEPYLSESGELIYKLPRFKCIRS